MHTIAFTRWTAHIRGLVVILLTGGFVQAQEAATADKPNTLLVRLIGGEGRATIDRSRFGSAEWGADLLLTANSRQRYGLRVSNLDLDVSGKRQRYLCAGVMLEMVTYDCIRMEIGTLGFAGRGENSGTNPFGIASFMGYEKRLGRMNLSIGYDSKVIFARPAIVVGSASVGVGVHF